MHTCSGEWTQFSDVLVGQLRLGLYQLPHSRHFNGGHLCSIPTRRLLSRRSLPNQLDLSGLHPVWLGFLALHLCPSLLVQDPGYGNGDHHDD